MAGRDGFSVLLGGEKEAARRLMMLATEFPKTVAEELNAIAEITMTDAKERTPVEFGVLKGSGKVAKHASARKLEARLTYGTSYAVWVHERTELRHPRGGEAKFLERALNKTAATFVVDMVRRVKARLGT